MKIMHLVFGSSAVFKYLGVRLDCKPITVDEVTRILGKAKPKDAAILRCRGFFYPMKNLLQQFKAHVWPWLERATGAIHHASTVHLAKVDKVQLSFLNELAVSAEVVFLHFERHQRVCCGTLQCMVCCSKSRLVWRILLSIACSKGHLRETLFAI